MKKTFSTEAAYVCGLLILALGTALMERANFGLSMIVAPAYIFHLKLSEIFPFFTFGMAEYVFQALLILLLTVIQRKVKRYYFFSFVTAVLYGFALDGMMWAIAKIPFDTLPARGIYYAMGFLLCTLGVAFLFRTYLSPEAYELFVKEIAERTHVSLMTCKTVYDIASCVVAIALSFLFFGWGQWKGIHWGTIVSALLNGWLIGRMTALLNRCFTFRDTFPLRKYFES